jgi:hypothetical protein
MDLLMMAMAQSRISNDALAAELLAHLRFQHFLKCRPHQFKQQISIG